MKNFTLIIVLLLIIMPLLFMLNGCSDAPSPISEEDDGGSHKYKDKEAPSVIESTDITDFECDFFAEYRDMLYNHCHFTAKKDGDEVTCLAEGTTTYDSPFHVEFTAAASMLTDLQSIVSDNELVKNNGFYRHTNGLPYGIGGSLKIKYASGEKLTMSDNSQVPFPCIQFCELFEKYAEEAGYLFVIEGKLYIPDDWSDTLSGWWVYMGEDADSQKPVIYMFTNDNKCYISPEFYSEYMYEDGPDYHDRWFLRDGKPMLHPYHDEEEHEDGYRIALTDEKHMWLIDNEYGRIYRFVKNSVPEARAFLEKSPYYYLADYGPRLCYIRLVEYCGKEDFNIEAMDVVLIKSDDYELIKELGFERMTFEKGYELYIPTLEWRSILQLDGETIYSVLDSESDAPASTLKTVTSEEFAEILRERGEMLAYVREEEALILAVEEFLPPDIAG